VVEEIAALHAQGRPVLVGTVSIENSEKLSAMLSRRGIPHQVLNAKHHEREARIIAQAGRPGAVTIATNMAGRGVDILLGGNPDGLVEDMVHKKGFTLDTVPPDVLEAIRAEARAQCAADREKVIALGGLHIIGTERHEARRIDNQLRGRAGRQGDPGSSRFYVALDDELMRRFGGQNIARLMERWGHEDDVPMELRLLTKVIENAQTKVEAYNFDIRKHVVEYDDVMNKHREIFYRERTKILTEDNLRPHIEEMLDKEIADTVAAFFAEGGEEERDYEQLLLSLRGMVPPDIDPASLADLTPEQLTQALQAEMRRLYDAKETEAGAELMRRIERWVVLQVMDRHWVDHLTGMEEIREGVGLRAYGQRDPLVEYKREAHIAFETLLDNIRRDVAQMVLQFSVQREPVRPTPVARHVQTNRDGGGDARQPARVAAGKVGRNDPCPCGSGKKYKRCCGR
jgi:preprotein translocase subunit SecA